MDRSGAVAQLQRRQCSGSPANGVALRTDRRSIGMRIASLLLAECVDSTNESAQHSPLRWPAHGVLGPSNTTIGGVAQNKRKKRKRKKEEKKTVF
jgi:hypothetical protein